MNQQSSHGAVVNYALPGATDAVDPSPNRELLPGFRFDIPDRLEAVTCQASDTFG